MRKTSIRRWLQDQQPEKFAHMTRAGRLESAIKEIDRQIDEALEQAETAVRHSLKEQGPWGKEKGMRQYQAERLKLWGEIYERFLQVISEPE